MPVDLIFVSPLFLDQGSCFEKFSEHIFLRPAQPLRQIGRSLETCDGSYILKNMSDLIANLQHVASRCKGDMNVAVLFVDGRIELWHNLQINIIP